MPGGAVVAESSSHPWGLRRRRSAARQAARQSCKARIAERFIGRYRRSLDADTASVAIEFTESLAAQSCPT